VKVWKFILTLLLVAAWLPATVHCGLETIGIVTMDECCEKEAAGNHRCEGGCSTVESGGLMKTECSNALPTPPEIIVLSPELSSLLLSDSPQRESQEISFKAVHLPQFVIRTALPIRGPSVAS
jgi:hypothetical protein